MIAFESSSLEHQHCRAQIFDTNPDFGFRRNSHVIERAVRWGRADKPQGVAQKRTARMYGESVWSSKAFTSSSVIFSVKSLQWKKRNLSSNADCRAQWT